MKVSQKTNFLPVTLNTPNVYEKNVYTYLYIPSFTFSFIIFKLNSQSIQVERTKE